jgi:hypothetical protein
MSDKNESMTAHYTCVADICLELSYNFIIYYRLYLAPLSPIRQPLYHLVHQRIQQQGYNNEMKQPLTSMMHGFIRGTAKSYCHYSNQSC